MVGEKLIENGITISSAESCTGGMFAEKLTSVPGISQVFGRSFVTYSNEAKMDELGVRAETLEKYGAVSEETALEMVEGLKAVSGCDVCISVTGVAGPGGGSPEKPVGLVYIGCCIDGKVWVECYHMNGDRQKIREITVKRGLDMLRRCIRQSGEE